MLLRDVVCFQRTTRRYIPEDRTLQEGQEWQEVQHGETRNAHKILVGKSEGRSQLGDLSIKGRMLLKWILKRDETCSYVACNKPSGLVNIK
jgi:hypothetical protein